MARVLPGARIPIRPSETFTRRNNFCGAFASWNSRIARSRRTTLAVRHHDNRRFSNRLGDDSIGIGAAVLLRPFTTGIGFPMARPRCITTAPAQPRYLLGDAG